VQKITVRHVELDGIEPETDRALGGVHESRADAVDILLRHLARRRPGGAERNGRGSDGLPGIVTRLEAETTLPWA